MSDTAATYERNREFAIRLRGQAVAQLSQARTEQQEGHAQTELKSADQYLENLERTKEK